MAEVIDGILIREVETKNIMTKSSLPVGGYSVNPYVVFIKTRSNQKGLTHYLTVM